jgi:hypothetical protein
MCVEVKPPPVVAALDRIDDIVFINHVGIVTAVIVTDNIVAGAADVESVVVGRVVTVGVDVGCSTIGHAA